MRYISESDFKKAVRYVAEHPEDVSRVCNSLDNGCPYFEIPAKHGRIVDLDKVLDWMINEENYFPMSMSAKIVNAFSDAPVIILREKPKKDCRICPFNETRDCQIWKANGIPFSCRGLRMRVFDEDEKQGDCESFPNCQDCKEHDECEKKAMELSGGAE